MKKYYNKLSKEYDSLYIQNILDFQRKIREISTENDYFVDFYPSFGIRDNEKSDFLVYGQAVNGWSSGFFLQDNIDNEKLNESIISSNSYLATEKHTPIDWVNIQRTDSQYNEYCNKKDIADFYQGKYRTYRSFFWNVTYKLICDYYNIDRCSFDWSRKLVYSNLYKIAPDGENPNKFCRSLQQPLSAELIKQEIKELKPKFCIVITNLGWWLPFQEILQTQIIDFDKSLNEIVSVENYDNTKIIVTNRPPFGNSNKFVQQILKLIKC